MSHLKWPFIVFTFMQLFNQIQTSASSNENVTINTGKDIQYNENTNVQLNTYSSFQPNPEIRFRNVTFLKSHQSSSIAGTSSSDMDGQIKPSFSDKTDYTSLSNPHANASIELSPISETTVDEFKYSTIPTTNKTLEKLLILSKDQNNSEEDVHDLPMEISSERKNSSLRSSTISVPNLSNKDVLKFDNVEPTSSAFNSQTREEINYTTLSEPSYEWTTMSVVPDSDINMEAEVSRSSKSHIQQITNSKRDGTGNTHPSIRHMPVSQTIDIMHIIHENDEISNAYETTNIPQTSQVVEMVQVTRDSSKHYKVPQTSTSIVQINTEKSTSQSQSDVNLKQNEGIKYFESKAHPSEQWDSSKTEDFHPNTRNDTSNTPKIVIKPLPRSTNSNKNLNVTKTHPLEFSTGAGIHMTSLPTYHPNDVIHISSTELYPISENVNISYEERHPCARPCKEGSPPMVCRYKFELEWYYTMSKACYDCPLNLKDCDRKDCVVTDGVRRPIVVVNRKLPGPSVEVCKGDRIVVDMENHMMEESTTIHWHGHHQRGTPYMDGVPYVTQCPIPPKSSFRYHYVADTPGTHFWHSHSGCQRADGVFGALIIRVPQSQDPHTKLYDRDLSEHVIQILDWDHKLGVDKFLAHHHANGNNKPITLLVNGRGRFHQFLDVNSTLTNVTHSPTATFNVQQGFRYRFRLINAGFLNCPIEISVDNHTLLVISSDGTDIKPVEADSLVTYAGERFDFVLKANQKVGNYWIRFRGLMDCDERFTKAHQVAILHYGGAPKYEEPPGEVNYEAARRKGLQVNSLNVGTGTMGSLVIPELDAVAEDDETLKEKPDMTFYLSYDFYEMDNPHYHRSPFYGFHQVSSKLQRLLTPQLNHISLKLPPFPLLSQHGDLGKNYPFCNESTVKDCENKYCECTHVIEVPLGAVLELVLIDKGKAFDANHPFHLHGHAFRVIAMERLNRTTTVEEVQARDKAGLIHRKLRKAPIKDTITVPDGGFTIVRVHASNPGYWLFHCHIEFHVELGMALVFKVGQHEEFSPVPHGFPRCNSYMPFEQELEELNNDVDNDLGVPVFSIAHWWPLVSTPSSSGSSKILVFQHSILLLMLFAVVR